MKTIDELKEELLSLPADDKGRVSAYEVIRILEEVTKIELPKA